MIVSGVLILLLPKVIGLAEYGYWQLYVLYCSYFNYLSFGLIEGVYLRYGGKEYSDLPKKLFTAQFWLLVIIEFIITICFTSVYYNIAADGNKIIVIFLVCLSTLISIPRGLLAYTLQATGQIRKCISGYILERTVYFILALIILLFSKKFELIIVSDIVGKLLSLLYLISYCKDITFNKLPKTKELFSEIWDNIRAGSNLLLANLASVLIVGIIRLSIEKNWGIETFGKVSLTISISNMILSFFSAISIVLFPMLRNVSEDSLTIIYKTIDIIITIAGLGLLLIYFPLKSILLIWIPNYIESLIYMGLIFPICIYESKMTLINNTYLKTLRKEKVLLNINIITVSLSIIISCINVIYIKNLNVMILTIVFLLAFRCIITEIYLAKLLKLSLFNDIVWEILLSTMFILIAWNINGVSAFIIYLIIYLLYLVFKRKDIYSSYMYIKRKLIKV
jgi:O-antigen/teichoic acid export membrane protein